MKAKEKRRLANKFGITDWQRGQFEEGLFDGLKTAEKYYKREKKERMKR